VERNSQNIVLIIDITKQAEEKGAKVITLMGNHDLLLHSVLAEINNALLEDKDMTLQDVFNYYDRFGRKLSYTDTSIKFSKETFLEMFNKLTGVNLNLEAAEFQGQLISIKELAKKLKEEGIIDFFLDLPFTAVVDNNVFVHGSLPDNVFLSNSFKSLNDFYLDEFISLRDPSDLEAFDTPYKYLAKDDGDMFYEEKGIKYPDTRMWNPIRDEDIIKTVFDIVEKETGIRPNKLYLGHNVVAEITRNYANKDIINVDAGLSPYYRYKLSKDDIVAQKELSEFEQKTTPGMLEIRANGGLIVHQPLGEDFIPKIEDISYPEENYNPKLVLNSDNADIQKEIYELEDRLNELTKADDKETEQFLFTNLEDLVEQNGQEETIAILKSDVEEKLVPLIMKHPVVGDVQVEIEMHRDVKDILFTTINIHIFDNNGQRITQEDKEFVSAVIGGYYLDDSEDLYYTMMHEILSINNKYLKLGISNVLMEAFRYYFSETGVSAVHIVTINDGPEVWAKEQFHTFFSDLDTVEDNLEEWLNIYFGKRWLLTPKGMKWHSEFVIDGEIDFERLGNNPYLYPALFLRKYNPSYTIDYIIDGIDRETAEANIDAFIEKAMPEIEKRGLVDESLVDQTGPEEAET
jgi:hypothetical protein